MLVFIDESGDSGLKIDQGSSRYFTIVLVVFKDHQEALDCDEKINQLRKEINWAKNSEFHFKRNSDKIRKKFLKLIIKFDFFYYALVINKDKSKLWGEGFKNKESFYKYACWLVFENAKSSLKMATVILDESGSLDFKRQLAKYIRKKTNKNEKIVKKVKMQKSTGNNLLQLADYVAGAVNRSIKDKKKDSGCYRKIIIKKEIRVQIWPK